MSENLAGAGAVEYVFGLEPANENIPDADFNLHSCVFNQSLQKECSVPAWPLLLIPDWEWPIPIESGFSITGKSLETIA